ncbi:MAG TPA: phosphoribosyltransferase [Acidimicrobiales bacterium]
MPFADRADAGQQLAERLSYLQGEDVVVLGLPRGGVPVAYEVAQALGAPLDVIVVRKLGVPSQPELAMGAIGEDGARVLNPDVLHVARIGDAELAEVEAREREELARRAQRFRGDRPRVPLEGRTAVVVDDGIATGATARAACHVAREHGAAQVILAVPVAPAGWAEAAHPEADEVVCVETPQWFSAIGQFYRDFSQTSDEEVVSLIARAARAAESVEAAGPSEAPGPAASAGGPPGVPAGGWPGESVGRPAGGSSGGPVGGPVDEEVAVAAGRVRLPGHLTVPERSLGVIVFVHGSGSSRLSPRNRYVAGVLNEAGLATLLFDLLTPAEEADRANVFDIGLLAERLIEVTQWLATREEVEDLPVGYFGASTGAGAALRAAAEPDVDVAAVVSRGGRPDLAAPRLADVRAPTLLIVGGYDDVVEGLNREAQSQMICETRLEIVPGATHLFEEPGTLDQVADLAAGWFVEHMSRSPRPAR